MAPWSRSHSKKITGAGAAWGKNREPEPLERKSGAAKKIAGSPALLIILLIPRKGTRSRKEPHVFGPLEPEPPKISGLGTGS